MLFKENRYLLWESYKTHVYTQNSSKSSLKCSFDEEYADT
jgi:hypothetical protein